MTKQNKKQKKKGGCLGKIIFVIIIMVILAVVGMAACSRTTDKSFSEVYDDWFGGVGDFFTTIGMDKQADIEVAHISQNPELPTGCEITSLTMLLNYKGFDVTKETLADDYLIKAEPGTASYRDAFLGNPRNSSSYGCYAPVIVDAANSYLESVGSDMNVRNKTGKSLKAMLKEVSRGNPVVIWGSMYIDKEMEYTKVWEIDGEEVKWLAPEHCMVLTGYDLEAESVTVCDPLRGVETYDMKQFEKHYKALGRQAVIITE